MGGLGNQLFQIFNTIAYSIQHNKEFGFPYSKSLKSGIERPTYWDTLFKHIKCKTHSSLPKVPLYKEPHYHYTNTPNIQQSFMFYGYFQSYKYFEDVQEQIYELIHLKEQRVKIQEEYTRDYENTVSLHFRIGDYASKQNYHPVMTPTYYKNTIRRLIEDTGKNNWKILYFYQEEDHSIVHSMISELEKEYPGLDFEPVEHSIEDWKQLLMMSLCRHNIIANSSFSWWGAYFNVHTDAKVYYPSVWFGPDAKGHNTKDLCPPSWSMITVT